jgi:membrane-bound lytic murein transglycosylase A
MTKTTRHVIALTLGCLLIVAIWLQQQRASLPDGRILRPAEFIDLPGWLEDEQKFVLVALSRSCKRISRMANARSLGAGGIAGTAADWRDMCREVDAVPYNDQDVRHFIEAWFRPWRVLNRNGNTPRGLFTGYYEPSLTGSRVRGGKNQTPLYARPDDLITVELRPFRKDLAGRRIAGRLQSGKLVPYPARADIVKGSLATMADPLVWVDDPIDAFFLQIQGSGRVTLDEGGELRLGYAATNGQPYTAIGRDLVARGALTREAVSLQTIRAWLIANPDQAGDVMALNKSYVFFRELTGEGPVGAQGVALTPARSLAVDRKFIPLGVPVWLDATAPSPEADAPDLPLQRLMVAQDTGGAIQGPIRGDVFWGYGPRAEHIAGHMKHTGRYFLLLPKSVAVK